LPNILLRPYRIQISSSSVSSFRSIPFLRSITKESIGIWVVSRSWVSSISRLPIRPCKPGQRAIYSAFCEFSIFSKIYKWLQVSLLFWLLGTGNRPCQVPCVYVIVYVTRVFVTGSPRIRNSLCQRGSVLVLVTANRYMTCDCSSIDGYKQIPQLITWYQNTNLSVCLKKIFVRLTNQCDQSIR